MGGGGVSSQVDFKSNSKDNGAWDYKNIVEYYQMHWFLKANDCDI